MVFMVFVTINMFYILMVILIGGIIMIGVVIAMDI